ncbi:MAG: chloride channel protein [Cyanobacteriota bacterium]|nr:chloride channel protein [Cyanobacteriota bacterium]
MQPFAPRPDGELQAPPLQWNLLAWAALLGVLTGLAVVGFHELLGFINTFLFGPFVEGLLTIGRSPLHLQELPPPPPPAPPVAALPGTPLQQLLQIGLGGLGLLPPPPPPPEPPPLPSLQIPDWLSLWPVLVVPTLGGALVAVLRRWLGDLGPGLPSLMAMADGDMAAAPRVPWLRLLTASLSLGSGASLGPEGPSVESGGNLGLWLALKARLTPQSQKALVAAGVAAGLAAGFKAPIAGVFFAFEGSFSGLGGRPSLRAVLVAAITSTLVVQVGLGDTPILRLPAYDVRSLWELPLYLGLGVLASVLSVALIKLLALGRDPRLQALLRQLPVGLPGAIGGLAVGAIALEFPQVLSVGYDTIEALLGNGGGIPLLTLVLLLGAKLLATGLSSATGFVGGGFAPALVLGAVLGNCYGQVLGSGGLHLAVAAPPAYAMVGMAAVLAGSARAPLTALILLFELTRDIRIVLPLMAAAGLSAALVERWQGLQDPGLLGPDPSEEQRRAQLAGLGVCDALEPEAPLLLDATADAADALSTLVQAHGHCLLVVEGPWVIGLVTLADLQRTLSRQRTGSVLRDCLRSELIWLPSSAQLAQLEDQLEPNGLRQLPVFDVPPEVASALPHGLPRSGLPAHKLCGLASRDGKARALARCSLNTGQPS